MIEPLRTSNQDLREDVARLKDDARFLRGEVQTLKEERRSNERVIKNLEAQILSHQKRIKDLLDIAEKLDQYNDPPTKKLNDLGSAISEITHKLDKENPHDRLTLHLIEEQLRVHDIQLVKISEVTRKIKKH